MLRRDGLAVDSPFPLGVPHEPPREPVSCPRHLKRSVRISRIPLSCRLHRTGDATYPDGIAARSTQRHVCRRDAPPRERPGLPRTVQPSSQRLADYQAALSAAPASAFLDDHMSAAGALRSTGITPRPHYYSPVRHPLVSPPNSRGYRGYTTYTTSSSRAFRPGTRRASPVARCVLRLRAAGSTPPMESDASASVRQSLLPSPPTVGLGPRHWRFSRHHRRSLALRPGHSLAIPWMTWSIGFSSVGFPSGCYSSYGALAFTPGGTDSH